MKNNYIIISNDKITTDNTINSIIKKINIKDLDIIKYDYQEDSIDKILDDLNTYNFLSSCKLIVYYNCSFLSKDADKLIKELKKYLINPSDNYLIMINDSISEKKEIKELINDNVELIKNEISSIDIVKQNLNNFKMDFQTIKYFCDYCLNNNEKIINELEKIKLYKIDDEDKNITINDINKIAIRDYNDDVFDLVNAIINKNKDKAFELYFRLFQKDKDSINIIASVAGTIRNLYSVKVLQENKCSRDEIAEILDVKPYAVSKALENCNNYSSKKLLYLLNELSDIDYKTKSGNGQSKILFEMFLISI